MTDDLVKRLRKRAHEPIACTPFFILMESAERIEALEAELSAARMQSLADLGQAGEAHAAQLKADAERDMLAEKLEQAVEALIATRIVLAEFEPHPLPILGRVFATLAAIQEKTDD